MKVLFATYFDHIERCRYNPGLIVENWVDSVVFTSNEDIDGINVVKLGKSIITPNDIPVAQNMCVDYCFDVLMADWVVYCMGDQYITEKGVETILEFIDGLEPSIHNVPVPQTQLYCHMWMYLTTITVSHRDNRVIYDPSGDGLNCNGMNHSIDGTGLAYDIGYIGLPQYWGKMSNHRHIWKDGDTYKDAWLKVYSRNVPDAVRMAYKAIKRFKGEALQPINFEEWRILLGKLDLMDDYTFCTGILSTML